MAEKDNSLPTTLWDIPTTAYFDEDDDYNPEIVTSKQAPRKSLHMVAVVIYSIAFLLGVMGNGLVIFITGFRMKRKVNTIWFLNLAVADFIFTFFLPFSAAYTALDFHWPFGRALCKITSTLAFLNLYASVYLLMVISIDRCISIVRPVWSQNHRTPRLASLVALAVWIVALALCSPNLYFRDTAPTNNNKTINCYNNFNTAGKGAPSAERVRSINMNRRAMFISRFVFGFLIPFTVIMGCYGAILIKLRRRKHMARSGKPFKVIAAVIVTFFFCWLPYHIFSFLEMNHMPSLYDALIIGLPLTTSLAFINSCLNPILYIFMGQDFKEILRRSLFSAFESAFIEESARITANTKTSLPRRQTPRFSRHHASVESWELQLCSV